MQVVITGKQLSVSDLLRGQVENQLADAISNYFEHAIEASVAFSRQDKAKQVRSAISVHVGRNIQMQGHAESNEAKAVFNSALERIAKGLRRYKRRLRDHQKAGHETAAGQASQYALAAGDNYEDEQITEDGQPLVITEMTTARDHLTVGEASMRMAPADTEALVFQNSVHGGITSSIDGAMEILDGSNRWEILR